MMKCPNCGKNVLFDSEYCSFCGIRLVEEKQPGKSDIEHLPDNLKSSDKYYGERKNGQKNGLGMFVSEKGASVCGEFFRDVPHGNCICVDTDGTRYVGQLQNSTAEGVGMTIETDGRIHIGQKHNAKISGPGMLIMPDGTRFIGEFRNGSVDGYGMCIQPDGSRIIGEFFNGSLIGYAMHISAAGSRQIGEFRKESLNGYGISIDAKGTMAAGKFKSGILSGHGMIASSSEIKFIEAGSDNQSTDQHIENLKGPVISNKAFSAVQIDISVKESNNRKSSELFSI